MKTGRIFLTFFKLNYGDNIINETHWEGVVWEEAYPHGSDSPISHLLVQHSFSTDFDKYAGKSVYVL